MTDKQRIIDRVRKLLAFSGETATEGEVENAHSMAQSLMEQYAIEQAEIAAAEDAGDIERARHIAQAGGRKSVWENTLAHAVKQVVPGISFYCSRGSTGFGSSRKTGAQYIFYGPAEAAEIARDLFMETRDIIATMAAGKHGGVYRGPGRSYAEGFSTALYRRAQEQTAASEHAEKLTAIVLVSEKENKLWLYDEHNVKLYAGSRPRGGQHYGDANREGQADGNRHDFKPRERRKSMRGQNLLN